MQISTVRSGLLCTQLQQIISCEDFLLSNRKHFHRAIQEQIESWTAETSRPYRLGAVLQGNLMRVWNLLDWILGWNVKMSTGEHYKTEQK